MDFLGCVYSFSVVWTEWGLINFLILPLIPLLVCFFLFLLSGVLKLVILSGALLPAKRGLDGGPGIIPSVVLST